MEIQRVIDDYKEDLENICARFNVRRLELFGSGSQGSFDLSKSDLDFLVEFKPMTPAEHADCYFGLLEQLQDLFKRRIDLVELESVHNPYFLEALEKSRSLVYAA